MRAHHSIVGALLLAIAGCGSDPATGPMDPEDDEFHAPVTCPTDLPEMREGMLAGSRDGNIQAELVTADKIPLGWYHNDWVVRFTSVETGEPLEGVMFGQVRPFMPIHDHDGDGQFPVIEDLGDGEFSLDGINITMTGPWEVQINIDESSAGADYLVFNVCNSATKPSQR